MIKTLTEKFEKKMQGNGIINFDEETRTGEIEAIYYEGGRDALTFLNENNLSQMSGRCDAREDLDGEEYLIYTYTFKY